MELKKIRKRQLSTLHTARLFSTLMILCGFVFFVSSLFLPVLPKVLAAVGTASAQAELATAAEVIQPALPSWLDSLTLFVAAMILLWAGYLLKSVVVLAETQFVE